MFITTTLKYVVKYWDLYIWWGTCSLLPCERNACVVFPMVLLVCQLLRKCILNMSKPSVEGPLGNPPFEKPSIAKVCNISVFWPPKIDWYVNFIIYCKVACRPLLAKFYLDILFAYAQNILIKTVFLWNLHYCVVWWCVKYR